jgi:hypothetical protein
MGFEPGNRMNPGAAASNWARHEGGRPRVMADAFTSPREIAQLNIEHYSRLLRTPLDERTRITVEKLVADEKAKLANLREALHFTAVEPAGKTRR